MADDLHSDVKEYYSERICCKDDVKTTVACPATDEKTKVLTKLVHQAVKDKYYGCGLVAPEFLDGLSILDLGCGAGMDCFMLAKLAGPKALITGVDMTDEQLKVANEYTDYHREAFGYDKANTVFLKGYIEDLKAAGVKDNSQDVIVSNCVVNLTADKKQTLSEAYRVLKNGGELYFSDYYADKTLSEDLRKNKVLWGECISGALQWEALYDLAEEIGFCTPIRVSSAPICIEDKKLAPLLDGYQFASVTYRLFKCSEAVKEGSVEVEYQGGIKGHEEQFDLSPTFQFKDGLSYTVPAEIGCILAESRFKEYFKVGKVSEKPCETKVKVNPFDEVSNTAPKSCCK